MEMGGGGAYVPARVALQGRIHRSIPRTQCVYFWYGNAATRTFGRAHRHRPYGFVWWIACGWLVLFGQIACKWLFWLCGIVRKNMMEIGRGGACVPARVALQGRIHRSIPRIQCVYFWMETPLRGRSGGHTGAAPTHFAWVDYTWAVDGVGQITCGWLISFG